MEQMPLDLKDFELYSSVLELRYNHRFSIWDRAGSFWTEIAAQSPGSLLKQAEPSKVTVRLGPNAEGTVAIDMAHLSVFYPGADLADLRAIARRFVPGLVSTLFVDFFTRIGL